MSSERFPIDFDNIWEKAGYKNRKHAVDAFKACVQNFNLTEGLEFSRKSGEIKSGPGRPRQSFDMTVGTAKRFLASALDQKGHPVIQSIIVSMKPTTTLRNHFWGLEGVIFIDVAAFFSGSISLL